MRYTVQQAAASLTQLLKQVSDGEEVTIVENNLPVAKLVPIRSTQKTRVPDKLAGMLSQTDDAFDALSDRELTELGFE